MKPFTCSQSSWLQVFMIRTAAKVLLFSKTQVLFFKKVPLFTAFGKIFQTRYPLRIVLQHYKMKKYFFSF